MVEEPDSGSTGLLPSTRRFLTSAAICIKVFYVHFVKLMNFGFRLFTGRSAEAGLDLTLSLSHSVSHSVTKTQMSHLETSNADSAQSKHVWNEDL